MDINKIQKMYFQFYEKCKRLLISRGVIKTALKNLKCKDILSKEEKKRAIEFYAPYIKINPVFHAFYKEKTGEFNVENLPIDFYINCADEYFNDRNASHVLDNKCLYSRLFPGLPMIEVIASRMGKFWYDGNLQIITKQQWMSIVKNESAVFVKAATESCGGKGVQYIDSENIDELELFLKKQTGDIVVQRPFVQHPTFAALNESSVNTLRILSLLTEHGVKVYSTIVRMGVGNTKVDNASLGGIFCGVREDGTLKDTAYRLSGESFKHHPTNGIEFDGYKIVGLDKAIELVSKAHPLTPYFRMVSWDVVINENGDAYMLEANFAKGSVNFHQLCNGPLFGEDTIQVLEEIFNNNK